MKNNWAIGLLFVSMFLLCISESFAQFQQLPTPISETSNRLFQGRILEDQILSLPFWDDFSKDGIDTALWIPDGITHSFSMGNFPPSLGVIVFDGVASNGRPYENTPTAQGITDQLTSKPIDLSTLNDLEKETVFLSFYWQAGGKAEIPDVNDQIALQFLNETGDWVDVWNQFGELEAEQFSFTQENIKVDEMFHHDSFQFRFQIRGRASGPFDSWLIDYVYLNKNRVEGSQNFFDRTLTRLNAPAFLKYSAIPLFELKSSPELYFTSTNNEFNNLENRFRAMEFTIEFREKESQEIIFKVNNNTPFNPVPLALERRTFESAVINDLQLPEEEIDWELVTYLSSGDGSLFQIIEGDSIFFPEIDLRKNDTARTTIPLRDFFAYDDGNIDYSAGINQRSGMLAVRYEKTQNAYLKGISINFTNFNQFGRGIDIMVWNDLNSNPIYVKEALIPSKENLEDFVYFEIDQNILLGDEFYIGFTQFTNEFIYIGLDKTRDNGTEIYYNVAGSWQQNELVAGSLMIRPHLSETPPIEESSADDKNELLLYPNPTVDILKISGDFELISLIDPFGRSIKIPIEEVSNGKILNFTGSMRGLYLINVLKQGKPKSYRILVK
ncbi:hypothetical protein Belba_3360 [Belliella baltica DSM 15883]|uniref:Secretion system C-terminal sorting domain-containing protein n=1 Tax=Belliella baltica (strain DSM 15883 / CIP 108006 / LMG 21964 / BA134) TaxID=866536 RepID=I3Z9E6_BELBD|nr:T9SS type A sorting domain-containing protein [Belliella baltica]AFL85864.1 hypothetical protein Belba_3360 [Belliella baltica DSM 15883]